MPVPRSQASRIGPMATIALLHLGLFFALQNGMLRHAATSVPHEVFATLIASPRPTQPTAPKVPSARPKAMPHASVTPSPVPMQNPVAAAVAIAAPQSIAAPAPAEQSIPAAPVEAPPKIMSSGVEYLQSPQPEYPAIARRMREEGMVMLRVLVNENGRPERVDVQKSSGSARLDEAARLAVLRALFKPHREDGKTVAVYAIVPIRFQLDT